MWKQRLTFQRRNLLQAEIERNKPDVILLSAYLSHRKPVEFIAGIAARLGVSVLLGGPAFTLPGAAEDWARITGVSAVFSGEAEFAIVDLVRALISGVSVYSYPGIFVHSEKTFQIGCGSILEPLSELNELPIPDLSDFPWKLYPHRIVPLMASRGCGWGRCTFCSDVITANGRTFRGRGLEHVLHEIEMQSKRYPGESTSDVDLTTQFLDRNAEYLDRVNLCRFKPIPGTAFQSLYDRRPERFEDIQVFKWDYRFARASYRPSQMRDRRYRLAVLEMLNVVHIINRKPLRDNMIQFDGLM